MDSNLGLKRALSESDLSSRMKKSCGDPNFINYVIGPHSLQNMAIVAIAVSIHRCPPLWAYGKNYLGYIKLELQRIALPQSLEQQIKGIILDIYFQWEGWTDSKEGKECGKYCNLEALFEKNYLSYWTMEGTIDKVKLLKDIFDEVKKTNNEDIDYKFLCETACRYCMEEYISEFRTKCSANIPFAPYWNESLRHRFGRSLIIDMVSESIKSDNLIAFKYFWNKLTEEEKRSNIKECIVLVLKDGANYLPIFLCFLLTHLDSHSEQREIFERYPEKILFHISSHSLFQRYFLPTFTAMLDFLNENAHLEIMERISFFIDREKKQLLGEMWGVTPPNLKKSFINYLKTSDEMVLIMRLIRSAPTINTILRDATEEDKREIIFRVAHASETYSFLEGDVTSSAKKAVSAISTVASKNLSETDYHLFKLDIMSRHGKELVFVWIIRDGNFASLDTFCNWVCSSQEECKKFREEYIDLEGMYLKLLKDGKWEHIDGFLKWYFETETEINEFKKSFVWKDNLKYCKDLIGYFSKGEILGWGLFEKFINFSCNSSDEIENAKNVFKDFFKRDEYFLGYNGAFSSLFMKWCNFE